MPHVLPSRNPSQAGETAVDAATRGVGSNEAAHPELDSRQLMQGGREVLIHHAGQVYRLRHTRNDKLILVK